MYFICLFMTLLVCFMCLCLFNMFVEDNQIALMFQIGVLTKSKQFKYMVHHDLQT